MITIVKKENELENKKGAILEIRGLSKDKKPTENVINGSSFIEMDTGKIYFYNDESQQWLEF